MPLDVGNRFWLGMAILLACIVGVWLVAQDNVEEKQAAEVDQAQAEEKADAAIDSLDALCDTGNDAACAAIESIGEVDDLDPDDPEVQEPERQEPEIQQAERQEREQQEREIQEAERADDEVQDPEVQDGEVDDPDPNDDPDPDDPDPDDPENQDPEIDDPEPNDPQDPPGTITFNGFPVPGATTVCTLQQGSPENPEYSCSVV